VLGSRRGRTTLALGGAGLAVVLACIGVGAIHLASSARAAPRSVVSPTPEHARGLSRVVVRKRRSRYDIAFFGDSVSVGAGASKRKSGYVAVLSRWLRTRGKTVVQTVRARGGVPVGYWVNAAIPRKLDAAIVELGTNDVRLGTSSSQFAREYRTLTSRIRAANPKVKLLCLSVWSHRGSPSPLDAAVNARIRAICPGTYVDITRFRDRPHTRSSDGFHPNDAGYRLIALAIQSKLKTS